MFFTYPIAETIEKVEHSIAELCERGCKMIWVDYLQEIRGNGRIDRRNEVSNAMRAIHRAAARGNAAVMVVSQFRRLGDTEKVPQIYHLKESGDIENKARIIILCHKMAEAPDDRIRFRLAKSTYGGEHITFDMVRDKSGTLRHTDSFDVCEDF